MISARSGAAAEGFRGAAGNAFGRRLSVTTGHVCGTIRRSPATRTEARVRRIGLALAVLLGAGLVSYLVVRRDAAEPASPPEPEAPAASPADLAAYEALEGKLRPLALPAPPVRPGDWLATNREPGQTFPKYLEAQPVRRSRELSTIYAREVGAFTPDQAAILASTYEYLRAFFDVPVKVLRAVPLADIPAAAQRRHPQWGDHQLEAGYLLERVLKPDRPADALAYIAFTAHDVWPAATPPEKEYNFVFGQASLRERVGVWSMYRFGDPARGGAERLLCLRRTLGTATHETGHMLTIQHCTAFNCNMRGANSNAEGDRHPLYFCPVCLRKLCWNLGVEPVPYLERLEAFCAKHGLAPEADYYRKATAALARP
jgi:archaemetzincin